MVKESDSALTEGMLSNFSAKVHSCWVLYWTKDTEKNTFLAQVACFSTQHSYQEEKTFVDLKLIEAPDLNQFLRKALFEVDSELIIMPFNAVDSDVKDPTLEFGFRTMECLKLNAWFRPIKYWLRILQTMIFVVINCLMGWGIRVFSKIYCENSK